MQPRRQFLGTTAAASVLVAANATLNTANANEKSEPKSMPSTAHPVKYCLNVSTINRDEVDIVKQVEITAKAGYDGIEIWLPDVYKYLDNPKNKLPDLRKRIQDAGLRVESSIGFGKWVVDDEATRIKGYEECGRDMEMVRELGGRLIAAPPAGATNGAKLNLDAVAERYIKLLEIGRSRDCSPQLEVWGFSVNFSRLSEVLYVLAAVQDPNACILPDVYHLYKGGSNFNDVATLAGEVTNVLHMNDYPDIPRDKINDSDRVYPGDGIAPVPQVLRTLFSNGFKGVLSLELFNRTYWKQDPNEVAKTGLAKMKASVAAALG